MQQPTRMKLFRITYSKTKPGLIKASKGVHLNVHRPVLEQYNYITLDKQTKNDRIKHKSTALDFSSQEDDLTKSCPGVQVNKWESTVSSYIESKKRIQSKRGDVNIQFSFHELDKANRHRYFKLIADEAIPQSIVESEKNEDNHVPTIADYLRNSLKQQGDLLRKTNKERLSPIKREQRQLLTQSQHDPDFRESSATISHQTTMNHFIDNYFRSKHKQSKRLRQLMHIGNNYNPSPLQRFNTT